VGAAAGRVAVLGAGRMGLAAAERLASKGFKVYLWSFRGRTLEGLPHGVEQVESLGEALSSAEAAVAFLADDDALAKVVASSPSRLDGLVFINSSTVTPRASKAAATVLEGRGACYVEAPVIGGPSRVREGKAVALVAGRRICTGLAERVIKVYAEPRLVSEQVGPASAAKLAYNELTLAAAVAVSEALSIAEAWGINAEDLAKLLAGTSMHCVIERYLGRIARGGGGEASFRAALAAKDLKYAVDVLSDAGLPSLVASAAFQAYKVMEALGEGGSDYTEVKKVVYGGGRRSPGGEA